MGTLLVVDDDEGSRRLLVRFLRQHRPVRAAASAEEAISLLGGHDDWSGFLIDVSLCGRDLAGLDVLSAARRIFPAVPAAVVSGHNDRETINRAARQSATYLCKPFGHEELTAFLERVLAGEAALDERFQGRLHALARRWGLAPKESDILAWLLAGRSRDAFLARSGMTSVTFRAHVARLLAKADVARTSDLVSVVLREEMRARRLGARDEEPPLTNELPTNGSSAPARSELRGDG